MKRRFTDAQEKVIRREFYTDNATPEALIAKWHMSKSGLRRIVGGPLCKRIKGIEAVYV